MRRLLLLYGSTILLIVVTSVGVAELLVEVHPFEPGQALYTFQEILESTRVAVTLGPARRAELALDLSEKHLGDLRELAGTDLEMLALAAFNESLDGVLRALAALPQDESSIARARLLALVNKALDLLSGLEQSSETERTIARLTAIRRLTLLRRR